MKGSSILQVFIFTVIYLISVISSPIHAEEGVTHNHAINRSTAIDSLCYNLHFNLREDPLVPTSGKVIISFLFNPEKWDFANEPNLLIDFKLPSEKVNELSLNGEKYTPLFIDDHIAVKLSSIHKGKNQIVINFEAGTRPLNRRDDFLYTLFVPDRAHHCFPCFDQPDLKASFVLSLELPQDWTSVSNTFISREQQKSDGRKLVEFAPTRPLSTYLFAFAAGLFEYEEQNLKNHRFGILHRETDVKKKEQLHEIATEVEGALTWLENYTGIPYPFEKYDIIILPGFQFGGMEHAGATFYNDRRLFLNSNATEADILSRNLLIAHETAHMWFGDFVTMQWFDDVWTKEVFANFMGANVTAGLHPDDDGNLAWTSSFLPPAMAEDRTAGTTPIRQELENLKNAGLVYNNIIYNKSPIMMRQLASLMGEDNFREGVREYLQTYGYANATWDQLIDILDRHSDADIKKFSREWVYESGRPVISTNIKGVCLEVRQLPQGHSLTQSFETAIKANGHIYRFPVSLTASDSIISIPLPEEILTGKIEWILPDSDGNGYALFVIKTDMRGQIIDLLLDTVPNLPPHVRLSTIINLNENRLAGYMDSKEWSDALTNLLRVETDEKIASYISSCLGSVMTTLDGSVAIATETALRDISETHPVKNIRTMSLRTLFHNMKCPESARYILQLWQGHDSPLLNETDFTDMALELAIRFPGQASEILISEQARISNPDRLADFNFVSKSVSPSLEERTNCFESLLLPENRIVEPRVLKALGLLCHHLRGEEATQYIEKGLSALPDIQATGDIFFPMQWCKSLLGEQHSDKAGKIVKNWLKENPDIYPKLLSKILIASHHLIGSRLQ